MTASAVVFIPESGPEIGMGHVYRLISMAQMLESVYSVSFLVPTEQAMLTVRQSGFDCAVSSFDNGLLSRVESSSVAVLDGYHFSTELFDSFRKKGISTIFLDDFAKDFPPADIVLNTADLHSVPDIPTIFSQYACGHNYILLRKEFLALTDRTKKIKPASRHFFICLGATDPDGLTVPLIDQLSEKISGIQFTILSSSLNEHSVNFSALPNTTLLIDAKADQIVKTIRKCDFAIVSASNIAQECMATGIPLACIQTAGNQRNLYSSLAENKLCYPLGVEQEFSTRLESLIRQLDDNDYWQDQLENQLNWIDGKSGARIRSLLLSLKLGIRDVQLRDSALLLAWKNDPVSLENSFNSIPVTEHEHEHWFRNELENEHSAMYLIELGGQPVSLVRFSTRDEKAVIGITVGPEFRGQRFAARSLILSCVRYFRRFPQHTVEAYIKTRNLASVRAFQSAGFRLNKTTEVNGIAAVLLTKTSN